MRKRQCSVLQLDAETLQLALYFSFAGTFLFVWVTRVGPEDLYLCMMEGTSWTTHAVNLIIGRVLSVLSWCEGLGHEKKS